MCFQSGYENSNGASLPNVQWWVIPEHRSSAGKRATAESVFFLLNQGNG